jgi:hypothetical protein
VLVINLFDPVLREVAIEENVEVIAALAPESGSLSPAALGRDPCGTYAFVPPELIFATDIGPGVIILSGVGAGIFPAARLFK